MDRLLKEGFEVVVLDNFSTGRIENITHALDNKNYHLIKGDIRDTALVKEVISNVDAVFHEAALISVPQSIENPLLANDINISGTLNLLKAALDVNVKRFIFASSAAVYGEYLIPKKTEDMLTNPTSPYGVTKLAAEKYLKIFHELYGLETVSLRYFNIYGPRQNFDLNAQYGGVITIFMNRLLNNLSPLIYGTGEQTRDFVYVQDIVEANMCALNCKNANGEVFNIGSGTKTSVNRVAEHLKAVLEKQNISNTYMEQRKGDVQYNYADIKKAISALNWNPRFSFEEGIKDLVDWYTQRLGISVLNQ